MDCQIRSRTQRIWQSVVQLGAVQKIRYPLILPKNEAVIANGAERSEAICRVPADFFSLFVVEI